MAYPTFIGARYLHSKSARSLSVITSIAIIGVALGVASLLVVVSVMSGFKDEFTKKVLGVNAHVLISKYGVSFTEYRDVMAKVQKIKGVRGVSPFLYRDMMISKGEKTSGVLIKGIDPERIGTVLDLPTYIVQGGLGGLRIPGYGPQHSKKNLNIDMLFSKRIGSEAKSDAGIAISDGGTNEIARDADDNVSTNDEENTSAKKAKPDSTGKTMLFPGIILGKTLAENLGAGMGDRVQVTTPMTGLSSLGWSPTDDALKTIEFKVVGIFYAGFLEHDTRLACVDYYQAQRFFEYGDSVQGVEITVNDIHEASRLSKKIGDILGGPPYHTTDWETLNRNLYTALMIQKQVLMVIVALLVGVAAFNIIAVLVMLVFDKRREIAILKSMGATKAGIALIFGHVGTVVGLVGIAIGLAIGFGICLILLKIGWPLDPKVYLIDHLPVRIQAVDFLLTAVVAFVLCLGATLLPSLSAAKFRPVDGIRQQ